MALDESDEWRFLQRCEETCNASITGKQRFIELLKIMRALPEPQRILDVGGSKATGEWFRAKFPRSKVSVVNTSKKEIGSFPGSIQGDAQCFLVEEKHDFIFAGEIIEHLYNPDGLLCSCLKALHPDGYFVITTPNLACIYNRVSLLWGWSLLNYFPSLRFLTGHPAYTDKIGKFGPIADHKSVFTWKGLHQLLELYGCRIVASRGFSYGEHGEIRTPGSTSYKVPAGRLRLHLNRILPKTLREGMLFLVRASETTDPDLLSGGILPRSRWEL